MAHEESLIAGELGSALVGKFGLEPVHAWKTRCRPRILVLLDGGLNYRSTDSFGIWRFLQAITAPFSGFPKPILTLAHRQVHSPTSVTIGTDTYAIVNNYVFTAGATALTLANFDQAWIMGINGGTFTLTNAEVATVSAFMNGGGGVFATGDHAALGRQLCGSLPRIRHMREWRDVAGGGVPMGLETVNVAVQRIDTVVNPGGNNLYEFADQSDNIPQRIYPNYRSVAGTPWTATVHPIVMLPGAPVSRTNATGFQHDLDVLPDHPHESQCYEVTSAATLAANYTVQGQNFAEFPPVAPGGTRPRPEIVAYAVSGGRSVFNGAWKPPVAPRMFGAISAYDGRLAMAYPAQSQRPGRIVCESTWHHYVNVNIDGTGAGAGRTGLGTGSGAGFVPSPDLLKIYNYWRNNITWLQPANRIWCHLYWELAEARFDAALREELTAVDQLTSWRSLVSLGAEARRVAEKRHGSGMLRDQLVGLLATDDRFLRARDLVITGAFGNDEEGEASPEEPIEDADEADTNDGFDRDELLDGVYGALLVAIARILPDDGDATVTAEKVAAGPDAYVDRLRDEVDDAIRQCAAQQRLRLERGLAVASSLE